PSPISFFSNDTATPEIYTLSLHDALPISAKVLAFKVLDGTGAGYTSNVIQAIDFVITNQKILNINIINLSLGDDEVDRLDNIARSEEHTSELQSRGHLVCRLLLEKKNIDI